MINKQCFMCRTNCTIKINEQLIPICQQCIDIYNKEIKEIVKRCIARIPDHTDMVDCGEKVFKANKCTLHYQEEINDIIETIKVHQSYVINCNIRLHKLKMAKEEK